MKTFAYGALGVFVAMLAVGVAFQLGMAVERKSAMAQVAPEPPPAEAVPEQPPYVTTQDGRFAFLVGGSNYLWRIDRATGRAEGILVDGLNRRSTAIPEGWQYTDARSSYYSRFRYRRLGGAYPVGTSPAARR